MIHSPAVGSTPLVRIEGLSRTFGRTRALEDVSLNIERGGVLGLIGGNGAGKTTLIKHILGLLKAQTGTVRVFGLDPVREPVHTLSRIGYLSEERDLPNWMTVHELMRYTQAFYPTYDAPYAESLRQDFDLDGRAKIKTLSRGQRARAGLLIALPHRPELLLLDEPSSGLDPVVRRDILGAIIRTIADEGRTVVFSSHLLDEVERVADEVAIIHEGRLLMTAPVDRLKESHRRLTLRFSNPWADAPPLVGSISASGAGPEWTYVCRGDMEQMRGAAAAIGGTIVDESPLTLDEIFVTSVAQRAS